MAAPARITAVQPRGDLRLRVIFTDGLVRDLDLGNVLAEGSRFSLFESPRTSLWSASTR